MSAIENTSASNAFNALTATVTAEKKTKEQERQEAAEKFAASHAVASAIAGFFGGTKKGSPQNVSYVANVRLAQIAREKGAGCTLKEALPEILRAHMRAGLEAGYVQLCEMVGVEGASLDDRLAIASANMSKVCSVALGEYQENGAPVGKKMSGLKVTATGTRLAAVLNAEPTVEEEGSTEELVEEVVEAPVVEAAKKLRQRRAKKETVEA